MGNEKEKIYKRFPDTLHKCIMVVRETPIGNIEKSTNVICDIDQNTQKGINIYTMKDELLPRICFHTVFKDEHRVDSDCYKLEISEEELVF